MAHVGPQRHSTKRKIVYVLLMTMPAAEHSITKHTEWFASEQ
jgi:hypothetical protein